MRILSIIFLVVFVSTYKSVLCEKINVFVYSSCSMDPKGPMEANSNSIPTNLSTQPSNLSPPPPMDPRACGLQDHHTTLMARIHIWPRTSIHPGGRHHKAQASTNFQATQPKIQTSRLVYWVRNLYSSRQRNTIQIPDQSMKWNTFTHSYSLDFDH